MQGFWRELEKVREIEGIDSLGSTCRGAPQQKHVINFRSHPAASCDDVHRLGVILLSDRHDFEVRENIIANDPGGLYGMNARLHRKPCESGVNFGYRMRTDKALVFLVDDAQ